MQTIKTKSALTEKDLHIGCHYLHNGEWNSTDRKGVFQFEYRDWYAIGESCLFIENISGIKLNDKIVRAVGFIKEGAKYEIGKGGNKTYFCLWHESNDRAFYWEDWKQIKIHFLHELQMLLRSLQLPELKVPIDLI